MARILTALLTAIGIMSTLGCGDDSTLKKAKKETKKTSMIGGGTSTCQTL